ncbi:PIN domain-like protein, partial [Mycena metata]
FNPGPTSERLILDKLFYQFCRFLLASITLVFIFDGPGRPPIKRGTRVIYRPDSLEQKIKAMITAFGYHFYDAPGEAEAELAQLNQNGEIDAIITDTFVFGAQCVIRTPSVEDDSEFYTADALQGTLALDQNGLVLCALLLGGDYDLGVKGAGPTVARALAAEGYGGELAGILRLYKGPELSHHLAIWRAKLRQELRTNPSGRLAKCQPKLADNIPDTFPNIEVANLYLNPLTSRSVGFTGTKPNTQLWKPIEPLIPTLSAFCSAQFGWYGDDLLKRLNSNLWPGVIFRMLSSVGKKPYSLE